ncbi:diguanylate cyclase domain-containing protein [Sulfobacillus thermosulfidooxidans]|uniref:diguanylate cyclase domain-containing protein n=1 Tax=Sulfobacillus thermosulfidooxidans TaxID=28034 RepID=UPI00111259C0
MDTYDFRPLCRWSNCHFAFDPHVDDRVVQAFAHRMRTKPQAEDVLVCPGGEEFTMWLPNIMPSNASGIVERLPNILTEEPNPERTDICSMVTMSQIHYCSITSDRTNRRNEKTPACWLLR